MSSKLSKTFLTKQKAVIEEEQKKLLLQIETLKEEDPFSDPTHADDNAAVDTDVREQVGHDTVEAEIKDATKRLEELKYDPLEIAKQEFVEGVIPIEVVRTVVGQKEEKAEKGKKE